MIWDLNVMVARIMPSHAQEAKCALKETALRGENYGGKSGEEDLIHILKASDSEHRTD